MQASKIITLTTDFGHEDSYVAQMKGAALSICPELSLIDLCHEVPPQDVEAGAYVLETGFAAFPKGTIHLAVVDPGVGTARRAVAVETEDYCFVAPDNGLLTRVLERQPSRRAHVLEESRYHRPSRSATFEGRDLFAPVAAWIARGVPLQELGPEAGELVRLSRRCLTVPLECPMPVPVLAVDHFGNAVLDVTLDSLRMALGGEPDERIVIQAETPGGVVRHFRRTYGEAAGLGPFLLINSAGYLELALDGGSAADRLQLMRGSLVRLSLAKAP